MTKADELAVRIATLECVEWLIKDRPTVLEALRAIAAAKAHSEKELERERGK